MADSPDAKAGADIKGVPEFWLTALRNHPEISELITERDEEVSTKSYAYPSSANMTYLSGDQVTDGHPPQISDRKGRIHPTLLFLGQRLLHSSRSHQDLLL